ncbi:MAG: ABC transporter substrate-binding protein [Clostridiales bacterium]|nr:ABC transporter substrate-binding protein [Clostridiales bacterium]
MHTRRRQLPSAFALFLAAALIFASCGGSAPAPSGEGAAPGTSPASDQAVVGILIDSTGDLGSIGEPVIQGAKLGFDAINQAGGVWGKPIIYKYYDTASDEAKAREMADQAINVDKVMGIVGALGSGLSKAVLAVAKTANVPMCSPSSSSPAFTTIDDNGLFVRTAASDALQGQVAAELAYSEGYRRAAVIALNNDYGAGFADVFVEAFKKLGGEIATQPILYDTKGSDFSGEVQKLAGAKPDVVLLVGYPDTGSIILKQAYEAGLLQSAHWILSEGMDDSGLPDKVGKDAQGKYILAGVQGTSPLPTGPGFDEFQQLFEQSQYEGRNATGPYVANGFDCAVLMSLALQWVGPEKARDGQAVAKAMIDLSRPTGSKVSNVKQALEMVSKGEKIDYDGASGTVDMSDVGDVLSQYKVWEITADGKLVQVKIIQPTGQ